LAANIQDAVKEKRMQKHICAEAIGTLLYVFLSEAGLRSCCFLIFCARNDCLVNNVYCLCLQCRSEKKIVQSQDTPWGLQFRFPAAVNSDSSGLLTNALGNGLALAVMIYSTAGAAEAVMELKLCLHDFMYRVPIWLCVLNFVLSFEGDNGSGGKLNPAVSTGLIITGSPPFGPCS
jgi:glycerol uptake facilitator-like aquaporin